MRPAFCTALLFAPASAWTTVHQTAFGAQFADIASILDKPEPSQYVTDAMATKFLGRIWHMPYPCDRPKMKMSGGVMVDDNPPSPGSGYECDTFTVGAETIPRPSNPTGTRDTSGLGGGIGYAWDPNLCSVIMPRFKETIAFIDLITCLDLRMAMNRAFNSWSNNHRMLRFIDVTEECQRRYPNVPLAADSCELIEVWITSVSKTDALDALGKASGDVTDTGLPVALAESEARYAQNGGHRFRMTNGVNLGDKMVETHKAVISFGITSPVCWYPDSSFCSRFPAHAPRFN